MSTIANQIIFELKSMIDAEYQARIFDTHASNSGWLGVRIPNVRRLALQHLQAVKLLPLSQFHILAEELMEIGFGETKILAFDWVWRRRQELELKHFRLLESWLMAYADDWVIVDDLCTRSFGYYLWAYPEQIVRLKSWTRSKNRWLRRGSAVSLIYSLKKREYLSCAFQTADLLLIDTDDMVQKGYGWMLKVASQHFEQEVFRYIMEHKARMPRTALRSAIEKMPPKLRQACMS